MITVFVLAIAVEIIIQIHILWMKLAIAVQHGRPDAFIDFFDGQTLLVGELSIAPVLPVGTIAVRVSEIDHLKKLDH
jgi:hypothetical protein